jgi:hypothetical protein
MSKQNELAGQVVTAEQVGGGSAVLDPEAAGEEILRLAQDGSDEALARCRAIVEQTQGQFSSEVGVHDPAGFFNHGSPNKKAIHFAAGNANPAWCELLAPYFDVCVFVEKGMRVIRTESNYHGGDAYHAATGWRHTSVVENHFDSDPPRGRSGSRDSYGEWETSYDNHEEITRTDFKYSAFDRAMKGGFDDNMVTLAVRGKDGHLIKDRIKSGDLQLDPDVLTRIGQREITDKITVLYSGSVLPIDRAVLSEALRSVLQPDFLWNLVSLMSDADEQASLYCRVIQDVLPLLRESGFGRVRFERIDELLPVLLQRYQSAEGELKQQLFSTFFATLRFAKLKRYPIDGMSNDKLQALFLQACQNNDNDMIRLLLREFGLNLLAFDQRSNRVPLMVLTDMALFSEWVGSGYLQKSLRTMPESVSILFERVLADMNLENSQSIRQGCQLIEALLPHLGRIAADDQVQMRSQVKVLFDRLRQAGGENRQLLLNTARQLLQRSRALNLAIDHVVDERNNTLLAIACSQGDAVMVDLLIDYGRASWDSVNQFGQRPIDLVTDDMLFAKLLRQVPARQRAAERLRFIQRTQQVDSAPAQLAYRYPEQSLYVALYDIARRHTVGGSWGGIPVSQVGVDFKLQTKPRSRTAKIVQLVRLLLTDKTAEVSSGQVMGLGVSLFKVRDCQQQMQAAIASHRRVVQPGLRERVPSINPEYRAHN